MFVLLPLALIFAAAALGVFVWAALSGQYDDVHTPAVRILYDDEPAGYDDEPAGYDDEPAGGTTTSRRGHSGRGPEGGRRRPI
jgi:cbb3-type cytochrome oxidase maturation protein